MKIGIIGAGNMSRAIGVRLSQLGHSVMFGARRPEQAEEARSGAGETALAGSTDDAASFGEIVIWTTREVDAAKVLTDILPLSGKTIVDINNRDYQNSVATGEFPGRSLGEQLQESLPQSHVVKAFTTIPMEIFDCAADELRAADAQTFIAGDDADAKAKMADLALQLGFRAIDVGGGDLGYRSVEALADVVRRLMGDAGFGLQAHLRLDTLPKPTLGAVGRRVEGK